MGDRLCGMGQQQCTSLHCTQSGRSLIGSSSCGAWLLSLTLAPCGDGHGGRQVSPALIWMERTHMLWGCAQLWDLIFFVISGDPSTCPPQVRSFLVSQAGGATLIPAPTRLQNPLAGRSQKVLQAASVSTCTHQVAHRVMATDVGLHTTPHIPWAAGDAL